MVLRFRSCSLTNRLPISVSALGLTLRQKQTRYDLSFFVGFFEADQKLKKLEIEHKSLILAQIERWRHALHMQVERQHGRACSFGGEWRTGE